MLLAVLETALYTEDLDVAETFYDGLLGLETITRADTRHAFFRLDGSVLLIFNPAETEIPPAPDALPVPPHDTRGLGHVCFKATLAEQAAWKNKLEAADHEMESKVDWPNGAQSIYFRDPAGNSIEFAEPDLLDR